MSTRWQIAAKLSTGRYGCIYVHCDGYPGAALPMLRDHYSHQPKIDALISLGDCLGIEPELEKCDTFASRGEDLSEICPSFGNTSSEVLETHRHGDEEYAYVWDGSQWNQEETP